MPCYFYKRENKRDLMVRTRLYYESKGLGFNKLLKVMSKGHKSECFLRSKGF